MKRIKAEEIQNAIQNHIKHRNISSYKSISASSNNESKPSLSNIIDMNLMALNDLSLIESTISDYYSFSLNSAWNEREIFDQFNNFKNFLLNENTSIKKTSREILIFAMFVYISIDVTLISTNNYQNFIHNNIEELKKSITLDKEQDILLEALKNFANTKDLTKNELINKWYENKCKIPIAENEWKILLNYLNSSKSNLLLNQINLNLQIIFDYEDIVDIELAQNESVSSIIKNENFEIDDENSSSINPKSLQECFNKINSQPSRITGACYFYTNDIQNEIISSSISPNIEYLANTTENSIINFYKLNEGLKLTNKKFHKHHIKLLSGHTGAVFKSKFTHDSKYLISCGEDGYSYLWNLKDDTNQYPICSYSAHSYPVWDVETFSRLNLFSTCSKDGKACLWSFDRLYPLRVYCGHQSDVNCVKFHPNGLYLATGSHDKTVRLWSVQTSEFVRLFSGHRSRIFSIAFSPDGNYLASAGEDRKIKIWDLRSGAIFKELKGHNDIVHSIEFDNNSEILCSGGLDKTIKFWDIHQKGLSMDSGKLTEKNPNYSNEIMRSYNVNFNVYSIVTDVQNVFYCSGAKKPLIEKSIPSPIESKLADKVSKEEKKIAQNVQKINPEQKPTNSQTVVMSTRRRSAITNQGNTPQQQARISAFNFNLNNDDLYEV